MLQTYQEAFVSTLVKPVSALASLQLGWFFVSVSEGHSHACLFYYTSSQLLLLHHFLHP